MDEELQSRGSMLDDQLYAKQWFESHKKHVKRLMTTSDQSYPATGSDARRPELWKGAHWNYFFGR
jgi:hypothetical protein